MENHKTISLVIPTYNEEQNILELYHSLKKALISIRYNFEFIFVDDGSSDSTLEILRRLALRDQNVFYIELSRNFGHQSALKAGLDHAQGACVISMDCDLQHPPEIVVELIRKWEEGYEVVYTKRKDNKKLPRLKRYTSSFFYMLLNYLSDLKLEKGTADFRLMSRNVLNAFSHLKESEIFIRGLVKWAGFKQIAVEYEPNERFFGESKYGFRKMISFALNGLTSFSTKPLKLVVYVGLIFFLFSLLLIPYALISYLIGSAVSGWTSVMISIFFFGSLQLLMMGIMGLYISKLVIQSKYRPLYLIRETNYHNATR